MARIDDNYSNLKIRISEKISESIVLSFSITGLVFYLIYRYCPALFIVVAIIGVIKIPKMLKSGKINLFDTIQCLLIFTSAAGAIFLASKIPASYWKWPMIVYYSWVGFGIVKVLIDEMK